MEHISVMALLNNAAQLLSNVTALLSNMINLLGNMTTLLHKVFDLLSNVYPSKNRQSSIKYNIIQDTGYCTDNTTCSLLWAVVSMYMGPYHNYSYW